MPGQESDLAQALIELAPLKHAPVPVALCCLGFRLRAESQSTNTCGPRVPETFLS